jgi:long-chain fatty acid transport protein
MPRIITPRLIPALLSIAFAGAASASGFQLYGEQNAAGIGNAGAGSAASAENASTVYYNPAGMTQLPQYSISAGLTAVYTSFEFNNSGSDTGAFSNAGEGGNGGGWGFVPNGYGTWAVTKDVYLGLGIGAPFGLKTHFDQPWIGSPQSTSFEIKTYNINPSIAWRATDWVSLGAGVNWQRIEATYTRMAGTGFLPCTGAGCPARVIPVPAAASSDVTLKLDDSAWGWNVGALFTLAPQTKLGIAYRSRIKYNTEGDNSIVGPLAAGSSNASADITLPDSLTVSVSQGIGDQWELLADLSWTNWSTIQQVDIMRTSGARTGTLAQSLDAYFDDTWRVALGANYKLNEAVKLRFGLAYDQTPVPSAQYRLTSLPDNNRTWFSTGVQWKPAKNMALDFGLAYLYMKDADIDNNQSNSITGAQLAAVPPAQRQSYIASEAGKNRGTVKGSYDDSAWLLGTQFSMNF